MAREFWQRARRWICRICDCTFRECAGNRLRHVVCRARKLSHRLRHRVAHAQSRPTQPRGDGACFGCLRWGRLGRGAARKARDARVIAIVGAGKEPAVRELGADVVVTRGSDGLDVAALETERIDLFADLVGGSGFESGLPLIHPEGGRYVTSGAIAGPVVQFDLRILYLNHLELIGSTIWTRHEFVQLFDLIAQGRIHPLVDRTFPLAELGAAQAAFLEKGFVGKLVIETS